MYLNRITKTAILLFLISVSIFIYSRYKQATGIDGSSPEISVNQEEMTVSVNDSRQTLLNGITAYDKKDGDVTDSLIVESISGFTKDKKRTVTYAAFDSDLHVTKTSRDISYSDYTSPVFSLESPLEFRIGTTNIIGALSCTDCLDGNISSFIKVIPPENFTIDEPGEYLVTFQASNSAGDTASIKAMVVMYDSAVNRGPQIHLSDYLIYISPGQIIDPRSYLTKVTINGRTYDVVPGAGNYNNPDRDKNERVVVGTDQIHVDSNLYVNTPGSYRFLYSMTIDAGNQETVTGTRRLCVIVKDE